MLTPAAGMSAAVKPWIASPAEILPLPPLLAAADVLNGMAALIVRASLATTGLIFRFRATSLVGLMRKVLPVAIVPEARESEKPSLLFTVVDKAPRSVFDHDVLSLRRVSV